jgi:hypothetical protein
MNVTTCGTEENRTSGRQEGSDCGDLSIENGICAGNETKILFFYNGSGCALLNWVALPAELCRVARSWGGEFQRNCQTRNVRTAPQLSPFQPYSTPTF